MSKPLYVIKRDGQGMGGFLAPPGHYSHFYRVEGYYAGLDYLLDDEYHDVPADVKAQARQIADSAELVCSEAWLRYVYGYFRNSYSQDGIDRNVGHAISAGELRCNCGAEFWNRKGLNRHLAQAYLASLKLVMGISRAPDIHWEISIPLPPPEHHLGYLMVRAYFPGHAPRLDLIADPGRGYGNWPCDKCGRRVQYEPRYDAWCELVSTSPWKWDPDCPSGGKHEVRP